MTNQSQAQGHEGEGVQTAAEQWLSASPNVNKFAQAGSAQDEVSLQPAPGPSQRRQKTRGAGKQRRADPQAAPVFMQGGPEFVQAMQGLPVHCQPCVPEFVQPIYWNDPNTIYSQWPGPVPGAGTPFGMVPQPLPQNAMNPLYHPSLYKKRFCASYPEVSACRRGDACAFAHSREEARMELLSIEEEQLEEDAMTREFFVEKFKTLWCPIGVQHDWQKCPYAHNYQDARRRVTLGYGPKLCPYWSRRDVTTEYQQRCPLGMRCPYSHGAKEQLYHPQHFRTVNCRDMRGTTCPRRKFCAFYHKRQERRKQPTDDVDYMTPLPMCPDEEWVDNFLAPPFPAGEAGSPWETLNDMGPGMGVMSGAMGPDMGAMSAAMGPSMGFGKVAGISPRTQSTESGGEEGGAIPSDDAAAFAHQDAFGCYSHAAMMAWGAPAPYGGMYTAPFGAGIW